MKLKFLSKFFKTFREDNIVLRKAMKIAKQVDALKDDFRKMTDEQLKDMTKELKLRLEVGETLDEIIPEAFATVREAAYRVHKLFPYYVQLVGGVVLHFGDLAEMRTGEGKTLVVSLPIYLNALTGKGVHVITVNEYLVERDAKFMEPIMNFLGLTVGFINAKMQNDIKRKMYAMDVTYTTNSELGFDYLRDNMVNRFEDKVQRGLNYAVVDEADSALVDEARTPLIISGGQKNNSQFYILTDRFSKTLMLTADFTIDAESKGISLTLQGIKKAEDFFGLENLFAIQNSELVHRIQNALRANFVFKNGVEYIIREGEIVLVDQFTGRVMEGRTYSEGLQQAIQAKEGVTVESETVTVATITYQALFRLYRKLCGTSGTAKTEEEEFKKIYNMRVICIPTNRPIVRKDEPDYIFSNRKAKCEAIAKEVMERNKLGQPMLLGTTSIEDSEYLSKLLTKYKIPHNVLNAKNHMREAEIIAMAGQKGSVTLSTNMAGRGTDIKLGQGVKAVGGLYVIGSERHEARRIDNQLRGRSGRQGDPGESRFYISIEDELFRRFGNEKIKELFADLGDDSIQSKLLSRSITIAQKKIEGLNFDTRKNLLDYDDILSGQREVIYKQRDIILSSKDLKSIVEKMQLAVAKEVVENFVDKADGITVKVTELIQAIEGRLVDRSAFKHEDLYGNTSELITQKVYTQMAKEYSDKRGGYPLEMINNIEKNIMIQVFDRYWMQQIDSMTKLRQGINLRSLEQTNPINIYSKEADDAFIKMKQLMAHQICIFLHGMQIQQKKADKIVAEAPLNSQEVEVVEIKKATPHAPAATIERELKKAEEELHKVPLAGLSVNETPADELPENIHDAQQLTNEQVAKSDLAIEEQKVAEEAKHIKLEKPHHTHEKKDDEQK